MQFYRIANFHSKLALSIHRNKPEKPKTFTNVFIHFNNTKITACKMLTQKCIFAWLRYNHGGKILHVTQTIHYSKIHQMNL